MSSIDNILEKILSEARLEAEQITQDAALRRGDHKGRIPRRK